MSEGSGHSFRRPTAPQILSAATWVVAGLCFGLAAGGFRFMGGYPEGFIFCGALLLWGQSANYCIQPNTTAHRVSRIVEVLLVLATILFGAWGFESILTVFGF